MPEFHQSFWDNTLTLMERQNKVTMRNTAFIKGRGIMVIIMGLVNASTFWNVEPANVQVLMGVLFQAVLFLSLGQASQIPTFMAARDIFYKQRGNNFYRTVSYVLSCSVSQIPLAVAETVVFGPLVYWLCGFVSSASAFIIYLIMLALTDLAFAAWFFFIASISPDLHVSKPIAMISVLFFVLFAGFIVVKSQMPDWLVWIYWIDPIAWCLRVLAVNQYRSSMFEVCVYDSVDYCSDFGMYMGEYYLSLYAVPSAKSWIIYGIIFMVVAYVVFMFLCCLVLEYKRYESPQHTMLTKKIVSEDEAGNYALEATPKKGKFHNDGQAFAVEVEGEREKNFTPVTLAFQDLWYSVPNPKNPHETLYLLKGVSGFAMSGSVTALMGSSGAGKTTLMDVIAGRKTGGTIKGKILLNGYEANDLAIRRCTGYCEQMDVHSEASTFREAFTFSAFLRQDSSTPDRKKYDSVDEVLDLLDMHDIADQIIRGSSVEQMKRLTIGVELAAQPSVIFLDEPTSGLGAGSAKLIMDGVRKVADSGRTIVCTIHQPSSEVFDLFDNLLLLKRGGETVFVGDLGEKSCKLVEYLEAIPGTPPLPKGYNPATWMLEVIGAGVGHDTGLTDYADYFKKSEKKRILDACLAQEGVTIPSPDYPEMLFTRKRAASSWTQARFLLGRFMTMYWRTPSYNLTRFVVTFLLALVFGLLFLNGDYLTYQGINGGVGMVFMTTLFNGLVSFNSVLPISCEERESFYRERAAQTYNALWYFVGSTLVEIPYVFTSGFIFTFVWFFMVGFTGFGTALLYWINVSLMILLQTYMGQFLAYALPSVEVAAIIGVLMNSIFYLFMGFNPPANAIPSGYKWLFTITPLRYPLAILGSLVFGQCDVDPTWNEVTKAYENVNSQLGCQPVTDLPLSIAHTTVKEYVGSVFGMSYSDMWASFGYVILSIAGNQKLMMKVCANKKILTTAKDNCNAYVTFVEEKSVDAALKLNGTTLVHKKIRVNRSQLVIDARRSIFLGNVPFKCTDDQMVQFFAKRLWTEEEPEPIENVRLIRDRESGLGKGFGYVLFKTQALVAKALALRELKMENRELRVQVCGKRFKNLRGDESAKEKFEGLRSSAGALARIQLKRKTGAIDLDRDLMAKKIKRTAAAAGLGKKFKPKHVARKAAKAVADADAAMSGKTSKKRKHDHVDSKKVTKTKVKKAKHAARKAA
ncbi:unnamed protein product [Peronospora belbahrii]|uniref:ABC transporter domain-containing protein n=1 Tax=Peronospora belbahrii TaxID=622444 RepID=A0AAU9L6S0_9STRA|nr:unnamed protein product [Peronospora belbahrii]